MYKYTAHITDLTTGETRAAPSDEWPYSLEGLQFFWGDGNMACDCNRRLWFARANGEPRPDDLQCGNDRYDVKLIDDVSGATLFDDHD